MSHDLLLRESLKSITHAAVIFDNHLNNLSLIMNEDQTKDPILKLFPENILILT